jgi:arginine decarboxylase
LKKSGRATRFITATTSTRWSGTARHQKEPRKSNKLEAFHDAQERREDAQQMFSLGLLELPDKARIETLYWEIGQDVVQSFHGPRLHARGNPQAGGHAADQYLCNFSVFQSLLDHWALGPVVSHHAVSRLNEAPERARPRSWTSPAIPTARSTSSLICAMCATRCTLHALHRTAMASHRAVSHRILPDGRLPGHHGRPAQSVRPRQRGACLSWTRTSRRGYYIEEIIEGTTIVQALASVQYDENELKRQMKAADGRGHQVRPHEAKRSHAAAGRLRKGIEGLHLFELLRMERACRRSSSASSTSA